MRDRNRLAIRDSCGRELGVGINTAPHFGQGVDSDDLTFSEIDRPIFDLRFETSFETQGKYENRGVGLQRQDIGCEKTNKQLFATAPYLRSSRGGQFR